MPDPFPMSWRRMIGQNRTSFNETRLNHARHCGAGSGVIIAAYLIISCKMILK
jgi:hypothetical protein